MRRPEPLDDLNSHPGQDSNLRLPRYRRSTRYLRHRPIVELLHNAHLSRKPLWPGNKWLRHFSDALPLSYPGLRSERDSNPQPAAVEVSAAYATGQSDCPAKSAPGNQRREMDSELLFCGALHIGTTPPPRTAIVSGRVLRPRASFIGGGSNSLLSPPAQTYITLSWRQTNPQHCR